MDRNPAPVIELPYRIVTERLVVRCWEPVDAPRVLDAVHASVEHLRPWMPWAENPLETVEEQAALLRQFRARFDLGEDFVYGILSGDERDVVGGTGLHTRRGADAFEIGYWIHVDKVGEGYATESTSALTRVAFECAAVDRVEIRCDPANERSRRIPQKLGYVEEATLRRRLNHPEPRDVVIYSLFRDDYASSPAAKTQLEAYDVLGKRVL